MHEVVGKPSFKHNIQINSSGKNRSHTWYITLNFADIMTKHDHFKTLIADYTYTSSYDYQHKISLYTYMIYFIQPIQLRN